MDGPACASQGSGTGHRPRTTSRPRWSARCPRSGNARPSRASDPTAVASRGSSHCRAGSRRARTSSPTSSGWAPGTGSAWPAPRAGRSPPPPSPRGGSVSRSSRRARKASTSPSFTSHPADLPPGRLTPRCRPRSCGSVMRSTGRVTGQVTSHTTGHHRHEDGGRTRSHRIRTGHRQPRTTGRSSRSTRWTATPCRSDHCSTCSRSTPVGPSASFARVGATCCSVTTLPCSWRRSRYDHS